MSPSPRRGSARLGGAARVVLVHVPLIGALAFGGFGACSAPTSGETEVDGPDPDTAATLALSGFTPEEVARILKLSPLPEPPLDPTNRVDGDPAAARLGQFLFFDTRLSRGGDVACVTCHLPYQGWADTKRLGEGVAELDRHTMSLWNVAYNRWFFWDGRTDSLWSQALQPLEDPREHAFSRLEVAHLLADDPDLRRAYAEVFGTLPPLEDEARFPAVARPVPGNPEHAHHRAWMGMGEEDREAINVLFANVGKAIAAFEREIVSRQSRFDRFAEGLRTGDTYALTYLDESARNGLRLFLGKARCHLCHGGPNFTDLEFHDNRVPPLHGGKRLDAGRYEGVERVVADPFNGTGRYSDAPTGAAEDKVGYLVRSGHNWSEFKTPTLRNAVLTAPYMHQGQLATIDDVIHFYDTLDTAVTNHHGAERLLQPLGLTEAERGDLRAFLESLVDESMPAEMLSQPETPWMPE